MSAVGGSDIQVSDFIRLTLFCDEDRESYAFHLSDEQVRANMIEAPVSAADRARGVWLPTQLARTPESCAYFAVRTSEDELIGAVGIPAALTPQEHRAEIGFWLAKRWRGQGIMSLVLRVYCGYVFGRFRLKKLHAMPFASNHASVRALEKSGFRHEGRLCAHYQKDGRYIDALAYGMLAEEWPPRGA